jgi:hypothetical protein
MPLLPPKCGCGAPARAYGFLCERCRDALLNWNWELPAVPTSAPERGHIVTQEEIERKLNSLSKVEWQAWLHSPMHSPVRLQ